MGESDGDASQARRPARPCNVVCRIVASHATEAFTLCSSSGVAWPVLDSRRPMTSPTCLVPGGNSVCRGGGLLCSDSGLAAAGDEAGGIE